MRQPIRFLAILAGIALLVGTVEAKKASKGQDNANEAHAADVTGKFVSFTKGVLTMNIPKGKYAGTHEINIPDGVPLIYFATAGHPTMLKTPAGFSNATTDMTVEVNADSNLKVIRVSLGDSKPAKVKKPSN